MIRKSGLPSSAVSVALLSLEMKRLVKQLPGHHSCEINKAACGATGVKPSLTGLHFGRRTVPSRFINSTFNILVAEDSGDDVFLLRQAFKKAGATSQLHIAPDGSEAVAYLKGEGDYANRATHPFPDLLLLDLNMPRMNGFEVLDWLRHDPQCGGLVVHVFTASPREADVQRAYELGANSFVVKPSRFDELVAFVTALHQWHRFTSFPRPLVSPALAEAHDLR